MALADRLKQSLSQEREQDSDTSPERSGSSLADRLRASQDSQPSYAPDVRDVIQRNQQTDEPDERDSGGDGSMAIQRPDSRLTFSSLGETIGTGLANTKEGITELGHLSAGYASRAAGATDAAEANLDSAQRAAERSEERMSELSPSQQLGAGITQFGSGFLLTGGTVTGARSGASAIATQTARTGREATRGARLAQTARRIGGGTARGIPADFVAFGSQEPRPSTALEEATGVPMPTARREGESPLASRLKQTIEGGVLGTAADALLTGAGRTIGRTSGEAAETATEGTARTASDDPQVELTRRIRERLRGGTEPAEATQGAQAPAVREAAQEGTEGTQEAVPVQTARQEVEPQAEAQPVRGVADEPRMETLETGQPTAAEGMTRRAREIGSRLTGEVGQFTRRQLGSLIERVRSYGGEAAEQTAQRARQAVDFAREAEGQMAQVRNRALRTAGVPTRDVHALQVPQRVEGQNYGLAPLRQAIEGKTEVSGRRASRLIPELRQLINRRGELFENANIQRIDPETGEPVPFRRQGDEIAPRVMSPEFFDIVMRGENDPIYNDMVDAFAHAGQREPDQVRSLFTDMRENMIGEGPEAATSRAQAEYFRTLPEIPDVLFTPGGSRIPITETNPYSYADQLARRGAGRIGVVRAFGQDVGDNAPVAQLREQFNQESGIRRRGGGEDPFADLLRGLSGISVRPPIASAGSETGRILRGINSAFGTMRELLLTRAAAPNIPEPFGPPREFTGTMNMLRGLNDLIRSPRETVAALESMGAISKSVANLSIDPNRPFQSLNRGLQEILRRISTRDFIEELGEKMTAAGTRAKVDRMRAGRAGTSDILDVNSLGFSMEDARRIARGEGTQAEYDQIVRTAPQLTIMSNLNPAQQSLWEHRRAVQAARLIQRYAMGTVRRTGQVARSSHEGFREAITNTNLSTSERWALATRSSTRIANHFMSRTAAGVGQGFVLAYLVGGTDGLRTEWNDLKDRHIFYLRDAMLYNLFAGPYGAVMRQASGSSNEITDLGGLIESIPVVFWTKELADYGMGTGRYEARTWGDSTGMLLDRFVPARDIFRQGAVAEMFGVAGFGNPQARELNVSLDAYWQWRFAEAPPPDFSQRDMIERKRTFLSNMRAAHETIRDGGSPEDVRPHILKALEVGNANRIASSLQSRRLLTKADLAPGESDEVYQQRLQSLRDRIGEKSFQDIIAHDQLMDRWVEAIRMSNNN